MSTTTTTTTTTTLAGDTRTPTTHTVAPGITLTVTGQRGHWKVWETDSADELRYLGTSSRRKADSAAGDVHDRVTDEKIAAAGLQDMARADRQAAAELAARKETTQALWDALRATVPPATTPEPVHGKAGGKKRRRRGGRRRGHGRSRNTTTSATTTTTGTASPAKPRQRRRKAAQPRAATVAAKSTTEASTPTSQRRSTRPSRRERREGALAASAPPAETTIAAAVTEPVVAAAVTVAEPVAAVAAPPGPRTTRVARTGAARAAVPASTVDDGDVVVEAQWAVYVQVDAHERQPANLVGDVGPLGDALSASLRAVLGDRDAGRARKAMRAGGLISGPTVYQAPAPRALRVVAAPLNRDDTATLRAAKPGVLADRVKALVDAKTAKTTARPLTSR